MWQMDRPLHWDVPSGQGGYEHVVPVAKDDVPLTQSPSGDVTAMGKHEVTTSTQGFTMPQAEGTMDEEL